MKELRVKVLRYDPDSDRPPEFETYTVPYVEGMSVLMALEAIQEQEPLAVRYSCHIGLCNICQVRVNGKPILSCKAVLKEPSELVIEPVRGHPVLRDLVVDMERRQPGDGTERSSPGRKDGQA
ncbi:MAG: 2Fe-2S iron-sulfur cluster-binding protein [Thermodesulfobacteriota bacterium]